jgi:hypothetical protein
MTHERVLYRGRGIERNYRVHQETLNSLAKKPPPFRLTNKR